MWLAGAEARDPGHADFWRAEPAGRFALFRGYQEDGTDFPKPAGTRVLDFSIVLWRVAEVLLYLESFANQLRVPDAPATVHLVWNGLEGRMLTYHKGFSEIYHEHVCRQDAVTSRYEVDAANLVRSSLITAVHGITTPLFDAFGFFSLTQEQVRDHLNGLLRAHEKDQIRGSAV